MVIPKDNRARWVVLAAFAAVCLALFTLTTIANEMQAPPSDVELLELVGRDGKPMVITKDLIGKELYVHGMVHGKPVKGWVRLKPTKDDKDSGVVKRTKGKSYEAPKLAEGKGFPYYGPMHMKLTLDGSTINGKKLEYSNPQVKYALATLLRKYGGQYGLTLDGVLAKRDEDEERDDEKEHGGEESAKQNGGETGLAGNVKESGQQLSMAAQRGYSLQMSMGGAARGEHVMEIHRAPTPQFRQQQNPVFADQQQTDPVFEVKQQRNPVFTKQAVAHHHAQMQHLAARASVQRRARHAAAARVARQPSAVDVEAIEHRNDAPAPYAAERRAPTWRGQHAAAPRSYGGDINDAQAPYAQQLVKARLMAKAKAANTHAQPDWQP